MFIADSVSRHHCSALGWKHLPHVPRVSVLRNLSMKVRFVVLLNSIKIIKIASAPVAVVEIRSRGIQTIVVMWYVRL